MKFLHSLLAVFAVGAITISAANARDSFSIGINVGGYGHNHGYYAPPPVYYAPPPVYYAPQPIYYYQPVRSYYHTPIVSYQYYGGGHQYNGHRARHHDGGHGWGNGHRGRDGHRRGHDD